MKLGFGQDEALDMTESEARGYLDAYEEIVNPHPKGGKKYVMKHDNKKSGK